MNNAIDLAIIAVYLIGTTLFGCSFFFRKDKGDGVRTFMTGGGRLPTWAIALSVFATARGNMVFLRTMTVLLAFVSIGIALTVVWIWGKDNSTVLGLWYMLQGVLSGGMLGLFLIGAFARRARAVHAALATTCGFLAIVWVTFGQKILPLPWVFHVNLSIVFATLAIVVMGFTLPCLWSRRA